MNTVLEMIFPLFFKWLNTLKVKTGLSEADNHYKDSQPQWVKDFKLVEWGPRSLFPEYLEMGMVIKTIDLRLIIAYFNFSAAVWFRNDFCSGVSTSSVFCTFK